MYDSGKLRSTYDKTARDRDAVKVSGWKLEERKRFLDELQASGKKTLLELGAGPGRDALFFKRNGLEVTATDLSPEMVRLCRAKGLRARVMDFMALDFRDASFDAVFALNSLLHTPKKNLPDVLTGVRRVLKPGGLFYLGVYGGHDFEGVWPDDPLEPQRFFAYYKDEDLLERAGRVFDLVCFRQVQVERGAEFHFQSLVLRKPQL